jgi:hypothetical protein
VVRGGSILPSVYTYPSNERGEKGKTWSQRPPHVILFGLGLRSSHHPYSASDQLISSQLNQIGVPLLFATQGRGGAEWRCVDFELGGVAHVWYEWDRGVGRTDGANLR